MTDTENLPALPEGWCWTILDDIILKISNGITANQNKEKKGVPVTRIESISTGSLNLERVGYLEDVSIDIIEKYKLQPQDILFSHINSDLHLGKSAIYTLENFTLLHGMNLLLIRPFNSHLSSKFLNYLFNYYRFSGFFISIAQHAVNQSSINQKKLKNIEIPLPPLPEQHRIVQKIEELFTDLDAGVQELEKAKVQIRNYRQAVLKLALQGKLVHQNPADETALKLIETIRADLIRDKIDGKKLISIDSEENLFELPDSWKWILLGEVLTFGPKNGYSPKPVKHVTNVRALTLTATTSGKFRDDCFKYIDEEIDANSHLWLEENDLLIQRGNTIEYVGVAAVYKGASNAFIYPDLMMKMRIHPKISVDFLHMVINSKFSRKYFEKRATGTAGSMPKINQSTIVNLPIPLPPLAEQNRIVSEIERRFSVIDQIEKTIDQSLNQAEKLRQSILKKAFEGKLVPQDPNDEPASVLLERIKKEKVRAESRKKPEKKTKVKAETTMEISGKTKQVELF